MRPKWRTRLSEARRIGERCGYVGGSCSVCRLGHSEQSRVLISQAESDSEIACSGKMEFL